MKYGLAVTGTVDPQRYLANAGAQVGDVLVLTKALGTGIVTTGIKRGVAGSNAAGVATQQMKHLNRGAGRAMVVAGAHAATDVTGFGLIGHLREMLLASGVAAEIDTASVPLLPEALELAARGCLPGGQRRNLEAAQGALRGDELLAPELLAVLTDPQTSGGLLISIEESRIDRLLEELSAGGAPAAAVVGRITDGAPGRVRLLSAPQEE
jgi:selenide,water dikinase